MAGQRAKPPEDITPNEFFTSWLVEAVAADPERRARLGGAAARIHFALEGDGGGDFTVAVEDGRVSGSAGAPESPNLRVRLAVPTWRDLNRGSISAPEAMVRRRVKLEGDLLLAIKLHFILG